MRILSIEKTISYVMQIGTLLASIVIIAGGLFYLFNHGLDNTPYIIWQRAPLPITSNQFWQFALSSTSLGLIQLGLFVLFVTQIIRILILFIYFVITKNCWFSFFSSIILLILFYSLSKLFID